MIKQLATVTFLEMMMGSIHKIIKKSPSLVKQIYYNVVPFEKRYGSTFKNTYDELMTTATWDRPKLLDYQNRKFLKLIHHAYNYVPYYKRVMQERGWTSLNYHFGQRISSEKILMI